MSKHPCSNAPRVLDRWQLEIVEEAGSAGSFRLSCTVGGGTYIRSLIRDIAAAHGTEATMTGLVRTEAGGFGLEDCIGVKSDAGEVYEKAGRVCEERGIEF